MDKRNENIDKMADFAELEGLFAEIFSGKTLVKIIFSGKRKKSLEYSKVMMRPISVSGRVKYQVEYTYPKKVTHKNLEATEAPGFALQLVCEEWKQVNSFTAEGEMQILAAKPEKPRVTRTTRVGAVIDGGGAARRAAGSFGSATATAAADDSGAASPAASPAAVSAAAAPPHNRVKNYLIPGGVPCDFLIRLGVMGKDGTVFPRSYGKFRQINRYLEIIEDVFPYLPKDKTLKIIDFGCGKAYLTFALYHYLKVMKGRKVEIIGLDLKEDVIDFCSGVARDLGYDALTFLKGDIADYRDDHADMVVTLHACDTATDYALINAVAWNTKVILSVPCCQHELFKQIKNDLHHPILKHGILKDRFTEYLTDGLRGLKLESVGYDVAMIEFTSLEHTARNIMIKAVKTNAAGAYAKKKRETARQQYQALCDFYRVKPTIEKLGE